MTVDDAARLVWAGLALSLVASSLIVRRLPVAQTLRMALAWTAIFGVAFVAFLFRGEAGTIWARAKSDLAGNPAVIEGKSLRIAKSDDGHFWVDGSVNGAAVRFLVDSGATTTMISARAAAAGRIEPDNPIRIPVETANGMVQFYTARIVTLGVGPIVITDARATIANDDTDLNLLGMSFLSTLRSWRVEGATMILEP